MGKNSKHAKMCNFGEMKTNQTPFDLMCDPNAVNPFCVFPFCVELGIMHHVQAFELLQPHPKSKL